MLGAKGLIKTIAISVFFCSALGAIVLAIIMSGRNVVLPGLGLVFAGWFLGALLGAIVGALVGLIIGYFASKSINKSFP